MNQIELSILEELKRHVGKNRRIDRFNLLRVINYRIYGITNMDFIPDNQPYVSDRAMRDAIMNLRRNTDEGALICSTSRKGGGYWLSESLEEVKESCQEEHRRAMNILFNISQRVARAERYYSGQQMGLL